MVSMTSQILVNFVSLEQTETTFKATSTKDRNQDGPKEEARSQYFSILNPQLDDHNWD